MSEKKIELHVHTKFSNDSLLLENFLLLMCKIKRIDIIVITDHNTIIGAHKIKDKFRKHNIGVIVGEEIFSKDGEIIGLFLNEKIDAGLSADETINQIKKQNGIVYIPHPYDKKREKSVLRYEKIIKLQDKIDLIESYNGRSILKEDVNKQQELANKINKISIVGSDAHTFFEIGRNYMYIEDFNIENKDDFLEKIARAKGNTSNCIKLVHFVTKIEKIVKKIIKGDFYGIYRIIVGKFKKDNK